jgi:uncharacterized membrane protein
MTNCRAQDQPGPVHPAFGPTDFRPAIRDCRLKPMQEGARRFMEAIALGMEVLAALLIAVGGLEALGRLLAARLHGDLLEKRTIWLHFAAWLVLALEFELGADVVRTALSPSWAEVGQLGAIALIRTFLNHFLTRDIREMARASLPPEAPAPPPETGPPIH